MMILISKLDVVVLPKLVDGEVVIEGISGICWKNKPLRDSFGRPKEIYLEDID